MGIEINLIESMSNSKKSQAKHFIRLSWSMSRAIEAYDLFLIRERKNTTSPELSKWVY